MKPLGVMMEPYATTQATGIGRYANRLREAFQAYDLPARTYEIPKWETRILGRRTGGYLSLWWNALLGSLPDAHVVHAANIFQFHRSTDVLTVHDLVALENPGAYGHGGTLWRLMHWRLGGLSRIITPSLHTKTKLVNQLDLPSRKIRVVHHGIADVFKPRHPARALEGRDRLHALLVGEARPRKNTVPAVQALSRLDCEVLLHRCGPHRPHLERYEKRWRELAEKADNIQLRDHGYLSRRKLAALYSWVDVLLYPSREEGFGFPPLEAAASGTPTITGPCPVFRETLGLQHWPTDGTASSIRAQLERLPDPAQCHKRLPARAEKFSWEKAARETVDVYREVAFQGGT